MGKISTMDLTISQNLKIEDSFSVRWCEAERFLAAASASISVVTWPMHCVTLADRATLRVSGRKPLFKFANYLMIGQSRTRPLQFSTASRFPITSAKFSCRRDVIALAARNGHQTVHQTNFPSLIIFGIRLVLLEQIWNYNL